MLSSHWDAAKNYECTKVSSTEFKVISLYEPTSTPDNVLNGDISNIKPKFRRVRTVHKRKDVVFCSCKYFERMGLMCRHIACVLKSVPGYTMPSHHDCAIRWWSDYMYYNIAALNENLSQVKRAHDDSLLNVEKLFKCLEVNDIKGPSCDSDSWSSVAIVRDIPLRFKDNTDEVTVLNYDISSLIGGNSNDDTPGYTTQTSLNDTFEAQYKTLAISLP